MKGGTYPAQYSDSDSEGEWSSASSGDEGDASSASSNSTDSSDDATEDELDPIEQFRLVSQLRNELREARALLPVEGVPTVVSFANRHGDGNSARSVRRRKQKDRVVAKRKRMNPTLSSFGFVAPSPAPRGDELDDASEEEKVEDSSSNQEEGKHDTDEGPDETRGRDYSSDSASV